MYFQLSCQGCGKTTYPQKKPPAQDELEERTAADPPGTRPAGSPLPTRSATCPMRCLILSKVSLLASEHSITKAQLNASQTQAQQFDSKLVCQKDATEAHRLSESW